MLLLLAVVAAAVSTAVAIQPLPTCSGYNIANSTTGLVDGRYLLKAAPCTTPTHCCALCTASGASSFAPPPRPAASAAACII